MNPQNPLPPPTPPTPPTPQPPAPQYEGPAPSNVSSTPVDPKQSIIERLGQANNVLVTVSASPTLDQLSACVGFSLFLNKMGKHATAVFSGDVPSSIEFLQPEDTLEKNTDSLRDFIISLDKRKADKLRYKVEDNVVKIFITPYKTSINEKDFEFAPGDFNVDVVVALGVHNKEELDQAIISHGNILHDATVVSITNTNGKGLGTLNLQDETASSLCEIVADISDNLAPNSFDAQMATAFLTGVVAETKRFSNEKTSPKTMALSAKLMAAGANQQLVATNLQAVPKPVKKKTIAKDGELNIDHSMDEQEHPELEHRIMPEPKPVSRRAVVPEPRSPIKDVRSESHGTDPSDLLTGGGRANAVRPGQSFPVQAPTMGGTLTANSQPEDSASSVNAFGEFPSTQSPPPTSVNPVEVDVDGKTLTEIERTVGSPHVSAEKVEPTPVLAEDGPKGPDLNQARDEVLKAVETSEPRPEALQSIRSKPMNITPISSPPVLNTPDPVPQSSNSVFNSSQSVQDSTTTPQPASPPPPVPPPMVAPPSAN